MADVGTFWESCSKQRITESAKREILGNEARGNAVHIYYSLLVEVPHGCHPVWSLQGRNVLTGLGAPRDSES